MSEPPLIIGHRGASAIAPENTLAAFARAIQDGADGIEFDVQLSRDGVPVVIHDATLDRTGLIPGVVSELSSDVLRETDVGSWFGKQSRNANADFTGEKLPSLQQVFEYFADSDALLYVEIKSTGGYADELAAQVVRAIQAHTISQQVVVSSFDLSLVQAVKTIDSTIRTAALFEPRISAPSTLLRKLKLVQVAKDIAADEICLHHSLASSRLITEAKRCELDVVVWTVDDPKWLERAGSQTVKALITNDPAGMLRHRRGSPAI
jgi:glycerophosphoryl diester phosphodiesterase